MTPCPAPDWVVPDAALIERDGEMHRPSTWALVSNGTHAFILKGLEGKDRPAPVALVSEDTSTKLGDIMADKPGRGFASSADGRRSAMEPGSDPVHRQMEVFAKDTLARLAKHHLASEFDRLAIFAAPKMLGVLRKEMPGGLKDAIVLERAANLIHLPEHDLRDTVVKELHDARWGQ